MQSETTNQYLLELLKQNKELNRTQHAVLTAINNLNVQLGSLAVGVSSFLTLTAVRNNAPTTAVDTDQELTPTTAVDTDQELTPTTAVDTDQELITTKAAETDARAHGYVNFDSSHDILKTKHWKKMADFTNFIGQMFKGCTSRCYLILLDIEDKIVIVNEESRFPDSAYNKQQDVYVNVNIPKLMAELLYIEELERPTPEEDLKRLWQIITSCEMHTRSSFEEKYGLKWVEPVVDPVVETVVETVVEPVVDPVVETVVELPKN